MGIARQALWFLGRRLPVTRGRLELPALDGEVSIARDDYGVPYIQAKSEHDAWYALGFCHAQDRAAQLEIVLRGVRGTLAELIGADGLPIDRLSRRIGFRRAGDTQLQLADRDVAEQIAAYVRGINAGYAHGGPRPHELVLLGRESSRWEPGDVHGFAVLFCFILAANWDVELLRLKILEEDGPEALSILDAPYPGRLPVSAPSGRPAASESGAVERSIDQLVNELGRFGQVFGQPVGSNAWAVAGSKTKSGRPILANDPHLPAQTPAPLYLAHLRCPDFAISGASWVGLPVLAPGHNGKVAWGITAAHADITDLFLEHVENDGVSVRGAEGPERCEVREELIAVRDAPNVVERVLVTPRGPIVSPALERAPLGNGANAISLAATWLKARPYRGFYAAHRAQSFEDFAQNFAAGSCSTISYVYADTAGHIGWHIAVEAPRRKHDNGLVPQAAWLPGVGWHDEPYSCLDLPRVIDPREGFVAAANNQPVADDELMADLGRDWLDGYRVLAIAEALRARDDWDSASTAALQLSTESLLWRELRETVLGLEVTSTDAEQAITLLSSWDGHVAADSSPATLFVMFTCALCRRIVSAVAPRTARWVLGRGFTPLLPHSTIVTRRMAHLAGLATSQPAGIVPSWPRAIEAALVEAIRTLRTRFGDDQRRWRWGRVRPLVLEHPFGQKPPFDRVFNIGPLEGEGDTTTVSQGGVDLAQPASHQLWLPSLRAVIDVGAWDDARFSLAGGQSGNPLSPHYSDQISVWRSGEGINVVWSEERVRQRTRSTLTLAPLTKA
jgi:penicillin amidase